MDAGHIVDIGIDIGITGDSIGIHINPDNAGAEDFDLSVVAPLTITGELEVIATLEVHTSLGVAPQADFIAYHRVIEKLNVSVSQS